MREEFVTNDVALVLQGGGTRGAFTAGVLDVFMENHILFPYVIGTSAGALNGVNYLSQDIGRSKYVSTELMRDKKFISFRNLLTKGSFFDFTYLFFTVPKEKYPFNSGAFHSSSVEFIAVATAVKDGKVAYFKKGETKEFYKALAASSSLPLTARPVDVEGELYLDGGVDAAIPFRKPLEDGFKKIVIVATRAKGFRKGKHRKKSGVLAWFMYRKHKTFRKAMAHTNESYNRDADEMDALEENGTAFVIRPDTAPDVKTMEKDQEKLLILYEQGRKVAERLLPDMLAFVGKKNA